MFLLIRYLLDDDLHIFRGKSDLIPIHFTFYGLRERLLEEMRAPGVADQAGPAGTRGPPSDDCCGADSHQGAGAGGLAGLLHRPKFLQQLGRYSLVRAGVSWDPDTHRPSS